MYRGDEVIILDVDEAEKILDVAGADTFNAIKARYAALGTLENWPGILLLDELRIKVRGIRRRQSDEN